MSLLSSYFGEWIRLWNRFWFQPRDGVVLSGIRICLGMLLFYSHLVWAMNSADFFGPDGVLPGAHRELLFDNIFAWSHLDWVSSNSALMVLHIGGLIVFAMFTVGLWTRVTGILAALLVISYANRATGALFGLDQICGFVTMYVAIGNSGCTWSVDNWFKSGRIGVSKFSERESVWNNISIRLIQVHMCIVYLFAGLGKLQGETWWNGEAIWGAMASYEYQTMDFVWLADYMWLVSLITLVTLVWEVSYAFLIWPRLTRPLFLIVACLVHLGIGLAMGMLTFGFVMVIGNMAFVESSWIRRKKNG